VVLPANGEDKKLLEEFYQPRTILLTLASEFTLQCTERYSQIRKKEGKASAKGQNETKFSDIVDEENAFVSVIHKLFFIHGLL